MGEGFIVRKGGGGAKTANVTITEVSVGFFDYTFTITNNDSESALILWEIGDLTPDENTVELASGATSSEIVISGLTDNTSYSLYAAALGNGKTLSDAVEKSFTTNFIETGLIVMYYGSTSPVPSGWALCDGNNGTPDLRNRFSVCSGDTYNIADTGGIANAIIPLHTHTGSTSTSPNHTHTFGYGAGSGGLRSAFEGDANFGAGFGGGTSLHTHSFSGSISAAGSSATNANLPPYRSLYYLKKV